jgi:flavin-dependent dehydrogenase
MEAEITFQNSLLGKRAIVVGAGIGGLSVSRVLADHFDEVVILDRDELPDDPTPRPGVPQGKHAHFLLASGTC